jgi:hypothetical protein
MENNTPSPKDEERAAIELWNTTCQLVVRLNAWAKERPELFQRTARQIFFWPGLMSRKRAFDQETAEVMEKIELGKNCLYRNDKQWRINEPATQFAIYLHALATAFAKHWQLPPLSSEKSKRAWFERSWRYVVDECGFVPEKNPVFVQFAKRAMDRNHKEAIKQRAWEAFDNLIAIQPRKKK